VISSLQQSAKENKTKIVGVDDNIPKKSYLSRLHEAFPNSYQF